MIPTLAREEIKRRLIAQGVEETKAFTISERFFSNWIENNVEFLRREYVDSVVSATLKGMKQSNEVR